jgi:hypothetical protein
MMSNGHDGRVARKLARWLAAVAKLFAPHQPPRTFHRRGGMLILKGLALLACAWAASAAAATEQAAPAEDLQYIQKEVTGNISYVGKRAISVELDPQTEMLLPVSPQTKLERLGSLAELKLGDRVTVVYRQGYKKADQGEMTLMETVALHVALMRRAPPKGTLQATSSTTTTGGR